MKLILFTTYDDADRPVLIAINPHWVWHVTKTTADITTTLHLANEANHPVSMRVLGTFADVIEALQA